jgi:hypothetical protein
MNLLQLKCLHTAESFPCIKNWEPVTVLEMQVFIACVLNMGIIRMSDLKDYWRQDFISKVPYFSSIFTCDRFFQIFGLLEHFQNVMVPSISILQGNNALANNNSPITTTPTTICSIDHFGEELLECCKGLSIYKV